MDYLFDAWERIKDKLEEKYLFIFLDFDGTLTPIVETPDKVKLSVKTKILLEELISSPKIKLAFISGRAIGDIKDKIGLKNAIYSGNHGLEIEGPKIKFESQVSSQIKPIMRKIALDLGKRLSGIKGVLIENKGPTLSVHYRLVSEKDISVLEEILSESISPYFRDNKINVNSGKKVFEIVPPVKWDKGKVVLWLLARQQFLLGEKNVFPVYIGDDVTDENAFKALKRKGVTILVGGSSSSKADYYLNNSKEVVHFLKLIADLKHN
jgi:trehalose-phosphatase